MRYIQAAVSNEDFERFKKFTREKNLTIGELIETAVKLYVTIIGKEDITKELKDCRDLQVTSLHKLLYKTKGEN